MAAFAENWDRIRIKIPSSVRVLAVTKGVAPGQIEEAYQAGLRLFGENYVQEALPKMEVLKSHCPEISWHFIGALQSNKAKQVVGKFSLIHSVDRMSLAMELEKNAKKIGQKVSILLEVNIGNEESKPGIAPNQVTSFAKQISSETELEVIGLMSFPPLQDAAEKSRPFFRKTKEIFSELSSLSLPRVTMRELSMGISGDFEVAIEEGATLVRIGTALFGPRS